MSPTGHDKMKSLEEELGDRERSLISYREYIQNDKEPVLKSEGVKRNIQEYRFF